MTSSKQCSSSSSTCYCITVSCWAAVWIVFIWCLFLYVMPSYEYPLRLASSRFPQLLVILYGTVDIRRLQKHVLVLYRTVRAKVSVRSDGEVKFLKQSAVQHKLTVADRQHPNNRITREPGSASFSAIERKKGRKEERKKSLTKRG